MLDLIIKNGQCYINGKLEDKDIAVKDGKILKIGQISEKAKEVYDAKNKITLPGCIDTQTHFRSRFYRHRRSSLWKQSSSSRRNYSCI